MAIKDIKTDPHNIIRICKTQNKSVNYDECLKCSLECKNPEGRVLEKVQPQIKSEKPKEENKDKIEYLKSFVNDIYMWRPRTLLSLHDVDDEFRDVLRQKGIMYGHVNKIVDMLIAVGVKDIPDNIFPRYVLSDVESISKYNVVNEDRFKKYGFFLHEREDLIRVCCFPLQEKGAVLWYRIQLPHKKIWEQYPDISVRMIFPPNYHDLQWSDIVIIQRYLHEFPGIMSYCKQIGKKVVFETDDLDIYISPTNPLYWQYQVGNQIPEMKWMLNMADVVAVTTNQLREEILNFNSDVCVFRNKIDIKDKIWNVPKEKNEKLVIGWVGGSSHQDDLRIVETFIQQVCNKNDVYFKICGYTKGGKRYIFREDKQTGLVQAKEENLERGVWDDMVDDFRRILGDRLLIGESLELEKYPSFFSNIDIVVAPLKDTRFNRGKSELKIVEAGGYSIPVVASDIEPYREIITHGENGFLANTTKDWIKYLTRLVRDDKLRTEMGQKLRKKIEKKYDANQQEKRVCLYRRLMVK